MAVKTVSYPLDTIGTELSSLATLHTDIGDDMYKTAYEPQLCDDGVTFTVEVGFTDRECLVSKNALAHLRRMKGGQLEPMETYRAFEDQIHGVARRLVVAGVGGAPLVLGAAYFV
ncbi:MAG: hypothetical protein JWM42_2149 [Burkholderia sp.]|jgi:hypothetical protein|nr:hypothetical protein [Burkholderia sp.]